MVRWKWRILCVILLLMATVAMFASYMFASMLMGGYAPLARADAIGGCTQPGTKKDPTLNEGSNDRATQVANAKAIDAATEKAGLSGYASRIAIITAMGESSLFNLDSGDQDIGVTNPDGSAATSFGLFQQQTSQGWGTKEQVMNPEYATTSFLLGPKHDGKGGLVSVLHWESTEWISSVIHRVQGNEIRDYYTKSIPEADQVISEAGIDINRVSTRDGSTNPVIDPGKTGCGDGKGGVDIGDLKGKWASPLPGSLITSGYGARETPEGTMNLGGFHYGLDMATASNPGTVLAPADIVITIASDVDGGTGAGTHVKAHTVDRTLSMAMYHMEPGSLKVKAGDTVAAGSPIGTEGATGNVTGRHLHLEFFKGDIFDPWAPTSPVTDPCVILKAKLTKFSCEIGATMPANS